MTVFSQRDSRWASTKLGFSTSSTIGGYGCLVACFGIVTDTPPDVVNQKLKEVSGFSNDLVVWAKVRSALPIDVLPPTAYDNDGVLKEIEKNGFCIVKVDFDGKISTPTDFHYVVYIGNQQLIDPWTGATKSTGWYPKVVGYCPCTKTVSVDQSLKWLKQMYQERAIDLSLPEGQIRYKVQEIFDAANKTANLQKQVNELNNRLEEAEGEVKKLEMASANDIKQINDLNKHVDDLKHQVINRDTQISQLQARVDALESQFSPDKVVVLTKEEYARLTASKTLDKFTKWELIKAVFGWR